MQPRPPSDPVLRRALARLEGLIDWERLDRSAVGPGKRAMRVDVAPARDLLARLGHPERRYRVVHVAGTKGKGSVAALIEAGLHRAGLRVGRYGSPHVESVVERLSLDGRDVAEGELGRLLEVALAAREATLAEGGPGAQATWFDVLTVAALLGLADAGVEWAVVECGLGGRLDSTNAVAGAVSVVTNVDLEHTALLGPTRVAIAREKGAILEPGTVLVTGCPPGGEEGAGDEAGRELERIARERGARLVRPPCPGPWSGAGDPLDFEAANAALAGQVLDELGALGALAPAEGGRPVGAWLLDAAACRAARLPGRLEVIGEPGAGGPEGVPGLRSEPVVVLDGAHVASSLEGLLAQLARRPFAAGPCTCVLALGRDKDALRLLKVLAGRVDSLLCTSADSGLGRDPRELLAIARELGLPAEVVGEPRAALHRAMESARRVSRPAAGWVLVTGSLHLIGAVRSVLVDARLPSC